MPTAEQLIQQAGQLLSRGDRAAAADLLSAALAVSPGHPVASHHLGVVLAQLGRYAEAVGHLEVAARAMPRDAGLQCNLGMLKSSQGDLDGAEGCFRAAVALNPGHVDARACLGLLLSNRQRAGEAEALLRETLGAAPARPDVVYAYTRLLTETGRAAEAVRTLRGALRVSPRDAFLQSKLCMMLNYLEGVSDEELLREHRRFGEVAPREDGEFSGVDRDPGRRLRVGYLSADLREHSVAYFLMAILEGHDRHTIEPVCYHVGAGDVFTERIKAAAEGGGGVPSGGWRHLFPAPDEAVLDAIRADGVDILVELAGHTGSNRLPVVARRGAPVQATYIGYPNTTGLPSVDYRIVDASTDPPGTEVWCTERVVRLEPCFLCYRAPAAAPEPSPLPCAASGAVTFGSFNNLAKLSPQTVELWSRLMASVPGSRLVLKGKALGDPSVAARFHERFAGHGIGAERLELLSHTPSTAEHLAAYARVDIALDPFPYAGTTTTCEALWQGVPVVTLAGSRHASRVGLSLLTTVGLPAFIARSPEEYLGIARGLAADPARLAALRGSLRDRLRASSLCDAAAFVPRLENAYRAMWRDWCAGRSGAGRG